MATERIGRKAQTEGWAQARQAMGGLWQLARMRQVLERGLVGAGSVQADLGVLSYNRIPTSVRLAKLARINGTLAEISEQIVETVKAVNAVNMGEGAGASAAECGELLSTFGGEAR